MRATDPRFHTLLPHLQVVSNRMKNSILVAVDRWHMNSKYKVKVKRTSKLMVGCDAGQPALPACSAALAGAVQSTSFAVISPVQ